MLLQALLPMLHMQMRGVLDSTCLGRSVQSCAQDPLGIHSIAGQPCLKSMAVSVVAGGIIGCALMHHV